MPGFITKTVLSLIPGKEKGRVRQTLSPQIRRSVDDITLPYLRPNNYPQPITIKDNNTYDITALVFLKTINKRFINPPHSVREANYWHNDAPFWNTTDIKRSLWWKYLHSVTLRDAKQIIAREVMDKLYKDIYIKKEPIIAIKVILFNGTLDKIVSPKDLRDYWFDTTAFNNFRIDRRILDAWGVKTGERQVNDEIRPSNKRPSLNIGAITTRNLTEKLASMGIDLDEIIKQSLIDSESYLKVIPDSRDRYRIKSKLRVLLNGNRFKDLFTTFFVSKLRTSKFASQFQDEDNRENLVASIISQIINDFIDKEVENL